MELDTIVVGNVLEVLPKLEAGSVHCSVSSPPYFGLRSYQGSQQCDWPEIEYSPMSGLPPIYVETMTCALGNEKTIESYIGHLVAIYRQVYRCLREDGVAFVVMGDSFASDTKWGGSTGGKHVKALHGNTDIGRKKRHTGLTQGNLMMVPHRLALALQADSWIVRNDVVYAKKACMPESIAGWRWEKHKVKVEKQGGDMSGLTYGDMVKRDGGWTKDTHPATRKGTTWQDCPGCSKCEGNGGYVLKRGSWRNTRAHEFVFMLTKKMQYFADQEKVREKTSSDPNDGRRGDGASYSFKPTMPVTHVGVPSAGRNPRSVLTPKPEPFPGSHFAVYPTSLIEPLIKATCPDKCCPVCGKGWAAMVEKTVGISRDCPKTQASHQARGGGGVLSGTVGKSGGGRIDGQSNVLGYRPTCECGCEDSFPGIILDPFMGAGTTALVAIQLGLHYYGIEISADYVELANERLRAVQVNLF